MINKIEVIYPFLKDSVIFKDIYLNDDIIQSIIEELKLYSLHATIIIDKSEMDEIYKIRIMNCDVRMYSYILTSIQYILKGINIIKKLENKE